MRVVNCTTAAQYFHVLRRQAALLVEDPLPLIVLKEGQAATLDDIKRHVQKYADAGQISRYAIPDQVRFVDSLAKTSVCLLYTSPSPRD